MARIIGGLPERELAFHFHSGRLCLDLVATVGERWRRGFERLRSTADLEAWAMESGLVDERPRATAAHLDGARELRDAIYRLAVGRSRSDDVAVINGWAERPDLPPRLSPDGGDVVSRRRGGMNAVLSTVARDAVDLLGGPLSERIRECAADDCALIFVDTSRPGQRRWCSMRRCGNRAKTAAYRQRRTRPEEDS